MMKKLFVIFIVLFTTHQLLAQDWRVNAGLGFPDCFHVGVQKMIKEKKSLGFQLGIFLNSVSTPTYNVALDYRYYMTTSKKFDNAYGWYWSNRLAFSYYYYQAKQITNEWRWWSLNSSIGRDINFSQYWGMNIDGGISLSISNKYRESGNCGDCDHEKHIPRLFPNLRIQLFRKF